MPVYAAQKSQGLGAIEQELYLCMRRERVAGQVRGVRIARDPFAWSQDDVRRRRGGVAWSRLSLVWA
jgi:hypothetical protein